LPRYKDDRGPFTERSACRDAPQLKSWSYRCVLSPSKKLGGRCERFLSVKVYALKKLKDFVQRSFRLPNTRGAHVSQDIVFHFYNNDDFRLKYKRDFIVSRKQTRICRIYTIVVAVSSVAVFVGSPRSLSAFDESSRSRIHVLSDSTLEFNSGEVTGPEHRTGVHSLIVLVREIEQASYSTMKFFIVASARYFERSDFHNCSPYL